MSTATASPMPTWWSKRLNLTFTWGVPNKFLRFPTPRIRFPSCISHGFVVCVVSCMRQDRQLRRCKIRLYFLLQRCAFGKLGAFRRTMQDSRLQSALQLHGHDVFVSMELFFSRVRPSVISLNQQPALDELHQFTSQPRLYAASA